MKKIIKFYGLPKTGTNVLYYLLSLNFPNFVANEQDHHVHYLGWKHGKPIGFDALQAVEKATNEKILFVFTYRDFTDWKKSVSEKHVGGWEFPYAFWNYKNQFLYNTPLGPEVYYSIWHFYKTYITAYQDFCKEHPSDSIIIDFKDLKSNQIKVVKQIKEKFNLELNYPDPIEIKKQIDSAGKIVNFLN
jgi:hypothetical protein